VNTRPDNGRVFKEFVVKDELPLALYMCTAHGAYGQKSELGQLICDMLRQVLCMLCASPAVSRLHPLSMHAVFSCTNNLSIYIRQRAKSLHTELSLASAFELKNTL